MSELESFYRQHAIKERSSLPWLATLQEHAIDNLEHSGFPSRSDEEWKYTSVDALLKHSFSSDTPQESVAPLQEYDLPAPAHVLLHNGSVANAPDLVDALPAGVLLLPLARALKEHAALVQPYLGRILRQEHGFHALNTAFIQQGVVLYIPKGVRIETPIILSHLHDASMHAIHLRHLIIAEEGAHATVIEEYRGSASNVYFTNTITELFLAKHAQLTHYKIQRESTSAYHIGHISVQQKAHSHFASHSLNLGAALARSDLTIDLEEEHASCLMNGIYAPNDKQHVDHHTTVNHLVPNCSSEQDYKGILQGRSRAVFNGKVIVAKDAQHTDAKQQNKNVLLSAHAEVNTKPQLEIFADDVVCTHGATVGQLDEEALFYLASRGIGTVEAYHYLIHAFAQDNVRLIPHQDWADWMKHLLLQQLG